jgi:chromosome segregation ATPase
MEDSHMADNKDGNNNNVEEYENKIKELTEAKESLAKSLEEKEKQIQEEIVIRIRLEEDMKIKHEEELKAQEKEIIEIHSLEIANKEKHFEEERKNFKSQLEQKENELLEFKDLQTQLDEKENELNKFKDINKILEEKENELNKYKETQKVYEEIGKELEDFKTQYNHLNNNYETLSTYHDEITKRLSQKDKELTNIKNDLLSKLNEKDDELTSLRNDLMIKLNGKNQQIENYQTSLKKLTEEKENELKALSDKFTKELEETKHQQKQEEQNLKTKLEETEKRLKHDLEAKDSQLEEILNKYTSMLESKANFEVQIKDLNKKLEQFEKENATYKFQVDNMKNLIEIKQTFKQFFFTLLEEDIFIDEIERVFKIEDSMDFFNEVYKLLKNIHPKILFKTYNSILQNDSLVEKLSKYNLEHFNKEAYLELNDKKQLDDIGEEPDFLVNLLNELCSYIDNLNNSVLKLKNSNTELDKQIKSFKDSVDESKKSDSSRNELLQKQISKLQTQIKESNSTIATINQTNETLEAEKKTLKTDLEKAQNKYNKLNELHESLQKEISGLKEKVNSITQQCQVFKVENTELSDKNNKLNEEMKQLTDKLSSNDKEKSDLTNNVTELEKIKKSYLDSLDTMKLKENEIEQLKTSYARLEEFIEGLKSSNEETIQIYKGQVLDLAAGNEKLKEHIKHCEDRISEMDLNISNTKIDELEKNVLALEIENKNLKEQKDKMKKYSEEILIKVKNDLKDTEFLIDKRMISNILLKYFDKSMNDKLKVALLDTLANFMGYNNDERRKIGLNPQNNLPTTTTNQDDKLKSLSDELYNFILND